MKSTYITIVGSMLLLTVVSACRTQGPTKNSETQPEIIRTNINGNGPVLEIQFYKGEEHNHPLFAIWVEDTNRKYIQTLYVSESIGTSIFDHSKNNDGKWEPGEVRRPSALPVWSHAYGYVSSDGLYLPDPQNPVPDAVSGPTPKGDFSVQSSAGSNLPQVVDVYLELNQSWDWNDYWDNHAFPGDKAYESSAQPSVIYRARIKLQEVPKETEMKVIGCGHYAGRDGLVNPETGSLTTALNIAKKIMLIQK
jgi:hypothetical protein